MELERKFINFKAEDVDLEKREITGYASTFESDSRYDSYGDVVRAGAFLESIQKHESGERRIKLLEEHRSPIGPALQLREDTKGLWMKARVSKTVRGDEVLTLIQDQVLEAFSIGFITRGWEQSSTLTKWGYPVRIITKAELYEVSVVAWPANEFAKIEEIRSQKAAEIEQAARTAAANQSAKDLEDLQTLARAFEVSGARMTLDCRVIATLRSE